MHLLRSPFLLLLLANLLVFYPAVNSQLFWDDGIFFRPDGLVQAHHPLTYWLSGPSWPAFYSVLKILHILFDNQYWCYKLCALLLHTINGTLLFTLLSRWINGQKALFIALLYTLHPMQVESVLWIFQMNNLLATCFLLIAVHAMARSWPKISRANYLLALVAFSLSLASKSLALFFPLLLLFSLLKNKQKWMRALILTLPFLCLSTYYGFTAYQGILSHHGEESYREQIMPAGRTPQSIIEQRQVVGPKEKAILFGEGLSFYASKTVIPYPLMFMYPKRHFHWVMGVWLAVLLVLFIRLRKRKRELDYFMLSWILAFLPTSGMVYIAYFKFSFVANRYMYLGLAGLIGLLVCIAPPLPRRIGRSTAILCLLALGGISSNYARIFSYPMAVYEHNEKYNPHTIFPSILLALKQGRIGQREQAKVTLDRIVHTPDPLFLIQFASTLESIFRLEVPRWIYMAKWFQNMGDHQRALEQLQKGLRIHPFDKKLAQFASRIKESL